MTTLADSTGWPDMRPVYAERREHLRQLMKKAGLDCLLVLNAADRFYLSGFELHDGQPEESSGCLVIAADGADWLATDSRYRIAAESVWDPARILIYGSDRIVRIAELLNACGTLVGTAQAGISWQVAQRISALLVPGHSLLPCVDYVGRLREIKSPLEISALRKSFRLNHEMFAWLEAGMADNSLCGISEAALAWEIEKFFRANGASELAFSVIAAAGKGGALPHAIPSDDIIVKNGPLLVDAGCRVDNYCSDQTRSFWIGPDPAPEFTEALQLVKDAQAAAFAIMKPGVACADVYAAALSVFERAGVAGAFTHGLGHGVGLETHESPSLSPASRQILAEGMVVTVEPGLYYPEWGGVRWEHTVVVEKDGIAIL